MEMIEIFGLQLVLSLLVTYLIMRWRIEPWLAKQDLSDALFWLSVPHAFRHLGLVFLVPGVVSPSLADSFAIEAGYGDLAAGILAILALIALQKRWGIMIPLVWLLNIVGFVDLANALSNSGVIQHLQSAWYIPTFIVPVLLITHFVMFKMLIGALRNTPSGVKSGRS